MDNLNLIALIFVIVPLYEYLELNLVAQHLATGGRKLLDYVSPMLIHVVFATPIPSHNSEHSTRYELFGIIIR